MAKTVQTFARVRPPRKLGQSPVARPCMALASRELQVARLICDGKEQKEIGAMLHVCQKTISTYTSRIAAKLKVNSPVQIALWMVKNGKVKLEELDCGVPECRCDCHCHVINGDYENPRVHFPSRPVKGSR